MWMNWMGATGAFIGILERTDQPTVPEVNMVHVDPCLYQQLDGGCPPGWENGAFGESYTIIGDSISITAIPINIGACYMACLGAREVDCATLFCHSREDRGYPIYLDCYLDCVNPWIRHCAKMCGGVAILIGIIVIFQ